MRELHGDWRDIFLGFRIAKDPRKVCLATVGLVISLLLIMFFASLAGWGEFVPNQTATSIVECCRELPAKPLLKVKFLMKRLGGIPDLQYTQLPSHILDILLLKGISWHHHPVQKIALLAVSFLVLLFIWSHLSAAICRIAAIEFAKDERIEMSDARKFARKKWTSLFWTPIVPLIGVTVFAVCLLIGGIVGGVPKGVGTFFVSLGFPLALLGGFIISLIAIGGVAGAALMFPAVSTEGTDAFDGISRAYSYVYTKPWRLIWYYIVASGYGAACIAFVYGFATLVVRTTLECGGVGMRLFSASGRAGLKSLYHFVYNYGHFGPQENLHFMGKLGVSIGGTILTLAFCVAIGFAISYFLSVSTIIYFLMRKAVDGTELTEIYTDEDEDFGEELAESLGEEKEEAEEEAKEAKEEEEGEGTKKKTVRKTKKRKTRKKKKTSSSES